MKPACWAFDAYKRNEGKSPDILRMRPLDWLLLGIVAYLAITTPAEKRKEPPIQQKYAGPWRGKGSFGKNFGPQQGHK